MKARMACTLFAVFALAGAFLPASAQVNPTPLKPQPPTEQDPLAQKSLQAPEATERTGARLFTFARDAQARAPQILQGPSQGQTETTADLPRTCAHILIYVAPPSTDDKMMIKMPRDDSNPTPTYQGVPACRRDFRALFSAALGPEFRFMKPGRPDLPPSGLEKPSSLIQPK